MRKTLLIVSLLISITFSSSYAHPFLLDSVPPRGSNADVGTTEVIVHYSEAIEVNFSTLKIYDSNGNQIDNKDTQYYQGEESLLITTLPLEEGIYTVASKVLSKVDGHLVDDAFTFGVGQAVVVQEDIRKDPSELIFFPEALSRFPGIVGQTIVLGSIIASLVIWGTLNKKYLSKEIEKFENIYQHRFLKIIGIGLILVFASNIATLAVQSIRLETSAFESLSTSFGNVWIVRMIITVILLGMWFWIDKSGKISKNRQIPFLVISLLLVGTSSMIGHGAASGNEEAIVLDYIHGLVTSVWIGGIIYFTFVLLPSFNFLPKEKKEILTVSMIPRFSIAFVISIGVVIISGPLLMWFLEGDVGQITESTYGKLIIIKILIASIMVGFGGYFQFKLQNTSVSEISSGKKSIHKKLQKSLKIDVILGIALLGVVALLINGTLPAGEIPKAVAVESDSEFRTVEFSENISYSLVLNPYSVGANSFKLMISDLEGNPIDDLEEMKVKISNPIRNIAPIEVPLKQIPSDDSQNFEGDITFGFSGQWQIEIEALRSSAANESIILYLPIKPKLDQLKMDLIEYELPEEAKPLYPVYDGLGNIWISDPLAPRLWKFNINQKEFERFQFDGQASQSITIDKEGRIWFTDLPEKKIGVFDPTLKEFEFYSLPLIKPNNFDSIPIMISADNRNDIWVSVITKDTILRFDPDQNSFEQFKIPTVGGGPFALLPDNDKIWFTESSAGKIGFIDRNSREIKEFSPSSELASPESITKDKEGNLWVTEHTGQKVVRFNPVLESFERFSVTDPESLPFGMAFDRYDNIWMAQHQIDKLGVYDPINDEFIEVSIPTETSFVQFLTADGDSNVWFAEPEGNKIGMVKITEIPSTGPIEVKSSEFKLNYVEVAAPLMVLGIIATSLFFVKSLEDKRRLNRLLD